jgi:2-iminobutanoate/2-iminopropanoate deaminase
MGKKVLETPSAVSALGPYSVAVAANGFVYFSGQVGLKPDGTRAADDVRVQTRQVMDNIGALLGDVGLGFGDVVKTTIFMADMADYGEINTIYSGYFTDLPPARSAVQAAALPGGFLVEIETIAAERDTDAMEIGSGPDVI